METVYGEKEALDDALTSVKTATGNYNTFSNECVHENVRNVMLKILEQEHEIQDHYAGSTGRDRSGSDHAGRVPEQL